jgi:hypothetical protein
MSDEVLWELSDSWQWATIADLGNVVSGGTPSTKDPSYWNGEINWITPADLSGYSNKRDLSLRNAIASPTACRRCYQEVGDRSGEMGDRAVTMLVDVGFHASTQPTRSAIALQEKQSDRGVKMGDRGAKMGDRGVTMPVDVGSHASTQPTRSAIVLSREWGRSWCENGRSWYE